MALRGVFGKASFGKLKFGAGASAVATSLPFSTSDWRNPIASFSGVFIAAQMLGTWSVSLIGKDRVYGAPGQVPDFDWSNPHLIGGLHNSVYSQALGAPRNLNLLIGKDALPHRWREWPNPTLQRMTPTGVASQPLGSARIDLLTGKDRLPIRNLYWIESLPPTAIPPRNVAIASQPQGSPRQENLLVGKDQLPIRQQDWPNPRGAAYDRAINSQMNGMPTTELSPADPFNQDQWPNPTLRLSHMQALIAQAQGAARNLNLLIGQDTFFGAPGQVLDYDWPVPLGPPSRLEAVTSQPQGAPATLAVVDSPFAQDDWPNPRAPQPPQNTQPQGSPLNLTLLPGQDTLPFNQSQWPNPRLRLDPLPPTPLGAPVNLTLLPGLDAFPDRQQDWPNPTLAVSPGAALASQPLGIPPAFQTAALVPAHQTDWPVPRGASQPVGVAAQPLGSPRLLNLLPGQDQLPVRQQSWPVPRGAQQPTQTQPLGQPFTIDASEFLPFNQEIWPVPRGAGVPLAVTAQPNGSALVLTTLVGQDRLPIRQQDWPVTLGKVPAIQTQPQGMPPLFLSPASPFAQLSWPNPRGPQQPVQTQPYGSASLLTLLPGKDALPVRQQDWPLPQRPRQPTLTQPQGVLLSPLAPFRQTSWPNPQLPVSRVAALAAQPLGRVVSQATPFRQIDWPNPLRPADRHPAVTAQELGAFVPNSPLPDGKQNGPNPVLALSPWVAITAQFAGCPSILTLYPGTDAFPIRQQNWPVPPGWPPRTQTQPQGVFAQQRRPAPPAIINKPCNSATLVPPILAASKVAVDLGASKTDPSLGGSKIPVILEGEKSAPDLSGEVKNDEC